MARRLKIRFAKIEFATWHNAKSGRGLSQNLTLILLEQIPGLSADWLLRGRPEGHPTRWPVSLACPAKLIEPSRTIPRPFYDSLPCSRLHAFAMRRRRLSSITRATCESPILSPPPALPSFPRNGASLRAFTPVHSPRRRALTPFRPGCGRA